MPEAWSLRRAIAVLIWSFASAILSSRKLGFSSTSTNTLNTSGKLSLRQFQETSAESTPARVSTLAARASKKSSSSSPVLSLVPPVRQTSP